jgi:hypothetical protein
MLIVAPPAGGTDSAISFSICPNAAVAANGCTRGRNGAVDTTMGAMGSRRLVRATPPRRRLRRRADDAVAPRLQKNTASQYTWKNLSLALLFGLGTKALPSWDSRIRRDNLLGDLAVNVTAGSSGHKLTSSIVPRGT